MKTITDYMEELGKKYGSYYAVAKELGITQASISIIRKGGGVKDETAVKMAELLGIDPAEVLLAAVMARSEGPVKAAWMAISKRAGIAASIIVVAFVTLGIPRESYAAQSGENIHYANPKPRHLTEHLNLRYRFSDMV